MKNVGFASLPGLETMLRLDPMNMFPSLALINTKTRKLTWDISVNHVYNFTFSNNHVFKVKTI